jgi:Domain of unknown function (DUF4384)
MNLKTSVLAAILLGASAATCLAQQPAAEDNSRRFWPPEFRPQASAPNTKPRTGRYKTIASARPAKPITATDAATMGVTLWLMRTPDEIKKTATTPAAPSGARSMSATDEAARILIKKKAANSDIAQEVIPERIQANTPLKVGQSLRLTVEVPQDGYLYVIDREKYADGKVSAPYLIFPSNPAGTAHAVKAGRVIELPGGQDVFEVKRQSEENNAVLAGELLSFIITPRPLEGLPRANADEAPILLTELQVQGWEKQWAKATHTQQLELENGAGKARTLAEQSALNKSDQALKPNDPLPQTVFRVSVKRGDPFIVQLPLRIGK